MFLLLQLLYDTIKLCLVKAAAASMTSIAFPTIGCNRLGYDPQDVAKCFLQAQRDTSCQLQVCTNEPTSLEDGLCFLHCFQRKMLLLVSYLSCHFHTYAVIFKGKF